MPMPAAMHPLMAPTHPPRPSSPKTHAARGAMCTARSVHAGTLEAGPPSLPSPPLPLAHLDRPVPPAMAACTATMRLSRSASAVSESAK